jgi:uncharacterized repeat protein (TIGR03803 family)
LTWGADGYFYGATTSGGTNGHGTLFKVTTNGALTTLVNFNYTNGAVPAASLTPGNDGYFYGTTQEGGTNGNGTVFKVTTNGLLTTLVNFDPLNSDVNSFYTNDNGAFPRGALILGQDGSFYGSCSGGGTNGLGTIFKMTTNGLLTTLYAFTNGSDNAPFEAGGYGPGPWAGLTRGHDGSFYGTTYQDGTNETATLGQPGLNGTGTIFKVSTNGLLTTLFTFDAGAVSGSYYTNGSGASPKSSLTLGTDGVFYGSASSGGTNGTGTLFKVTTNGLFSPLYTFGAGVTNAGYPQSGMVPGSDGSLYGTTLAGVNRTGTIFRVTTNGAFTALYSFGPAGFDSNSAYTNADGTGPSILTLGTDGSFYGATVGGGTNGYGSLFKLSLGNAPAPVYLNAQRQATNLIFSWSNPAFNLQTATNASGSYATIPAAASPYTNPITGAQKFFRLIGN